MCIRDRLRSRPMLLALQLGRLKDNGELRPEQVSLGKLNTVCEAIAIAREHVASCQDARLRVFVASRVDARVAVGALTGSRAGGCLARTRSRSWSCRARRSRRI